MRFKKKSDYNHNENAGEQRQVDSLVIILLLLLLRMHFLWSVKKMKICTVEIFNSLSFCLKILDSTLRSRALASLSEQLGPFCLLRSFLFPGFKPVNPVRRCRSDDDDALTAPWNPPLLLTDAHKMTPVEVPSWRRQVALYSVPVWTRGRVRMSLVWVEDKEVNTA